MFMAFEVLTQKSLWTVLHIQLIKYTKKHLI